MYVHTYILICHHCKNALHGLVERYKTFHHHDLEPFEPFEPLEALQPLEPVHYQVDLGFYRMKTGSEPEAKNVMIHSTDQTQNPKNPPLYKSVFDQYCVESVDRAN